MYIFISGRRERNLQRYKSDKHRLEGEVDEMEKKVDRMNTMKVQVRFITTITSYFLFIYILTINRIGGIMVSVLA